MPIPPCALRSSTGFFSDFDLTILDQLPCDIDSLLHYTLGRSRKPLSTLNVFFGALLYVGKSPLEVEGEVQIPLVVSLRNQIGDESPEFSTGFEINLELLLALERDIAFHLRR